MGKLKLIPIYLLDFTYVMTIYISTGIFLSLLMDGYILEPISIESVKRKTTFILYAEVLLQLLIQTLITVILALLLQYIPSPVNGLYGYSTLNTEGKIIRNPAVITMLLYHFSSSLKIRLNELFNRLAKYKIG